MALLAQFLFGHIEFYQDLQSHYKFFKEHLRGCAEVPNSGHRGMFCLDSMVETRSTETNYNVNDKLKPDVWLEPCQVSWKKEKLEKETPYLRPFPSFIKKHDICARCGRSELLI